MNLDKYFDKVYDSSKYNCAHFVCEIWNELFKIDISWALNGVLTNLGNRKLHAHRLNAFERLALPSGVCLALFQAQRKEPHVGIFLEGRILHITKNGVEWSHIETIMTRFNKVRFYNVKNNFNS